MKIGTQTIDLDALTGEETLELAKAVIDELGTELLMDGSRLLDGGGRQAMRRKSVPFPNIETLCTYLGLSERRLRQLKAEGKLDYDTDVVIVDLGQLKAMVKKLNAKATSVSEPPTNQEV